MNTVDLLMNIGTVLSLISTAPQFRAVWENRKNLQGYSPLGTTLLAIAMTSFGIAFVFMENWFAMGCNIPIAVFWSIAAYYSYKSRGEVQINKDKIPGTVGTEKDVNYEVVWDVDWYGHMYRVERTDEPVQGDRFLFYVDDKLVESRKVVEREDEWAAIESLMVSSPEWKRTMVSHKDGGEEP